MKAFKRQLTEKNKDWLISALESVGDGMITFDMAGVIDFVNDEALCILGLNLVQVLKANFNDIFIIRDQSDQQTSLFAEGRTLSTQGAGLPHRASYIKPSGEQRKLSAHLSPLMDSDSVQLGYVVIFRDVTHIVRAEESLEAERHNLDNLFELMPTAMLVINEEAVVLRTNQYFLSIFGLKKEYIVGRPFGDAIGCVFSFENGCGRSSSCMYCKFRKAVMDLVDTGKPVRDRIIHIEYYQNEQPISAWISVNLMPIEQDQRVNYVVTLIDVTARIEHEKHLEEARQSSLAILDSLPVMIYRTKSNREWDFVNETFRSHLCINTGMFTEALCPFMLQEDYERFECAFETALATQNGFNIEISLLLEKGTYRTVLALARPYIDKDGQFAGLIGLFLDINDAKMAEHLYLQSQSKYYSLFKNLESSISYYRLILDNQGNVSDAEILEVNDTTERLFGISTANLLGKRISELSFLTPSERSGLIEGFGQVFHMNENVHIDEYLFDTLGKWVEVSLYSPEKDYIAMLVSDIDFKKRATIELKNEMERSEEANRAKSEFLANMSHEIRTPLNGIVGMLDLTMLEPLSREQNDNLMTAKGCVQSLIDIINDVLDFAKIEAGKLSLDDQSFNIIELMEDVFKTQKVHAMEKKLELVAAYEGISQGYIIGDGKRLKQVMNNLIGNAIKFTNEGFVRIEVSQRPHEIDHEMLYLMISVADTGIGIPKEKQGMLFKSFTQIDGSYTRQYGGTGLGLVITKQLVEMMKGSIRFTTDYGKGSTFTVEIPVQKAERPHQSARKAEPAPVFGNSRILLAEDDRVNQIVISKILESFGLVVELANNGQEAVRMASAQAFDLILMDIQMPIMDGVQATVAIRSAESTKMEKTRQRSKHVPIIALTAFALKGDEAIFKASGMDDYLSKPVDRPQMLELMKRYLAVVDSDWDYVKKIICARTEQAEAPIEPGQEIYQFEDGTRQELEKKLIQLKTAYEEGNSVILEVIAHQLKQLFEAQNAEELKNLTFKMELEIRKDRLENVPGLLNRIEHMWQMISGIKNKEGQQ